MESIRTMNGNENGLVYKLIYTSLNDKFYGLNTVFQIEWTYQNRIFQLKIEKGTLDGKIVSPDGQYLILIFRGGTNFPEPCNCVIYKLDGQIYKIICTPFMDNEEIITWYQGHQNIKAIQGEIFSGGIRKNQQDEDIVFLNIWYKTIARSPYVEPYREMREFNLETGEIGKIISWELPYR